MKLTKQYISENLLRKDGKLNNRRLNGLEPEDIYLSFHSIEKPTCKNCNKEVKFKSFTEGYQTYCGYSCSSKHQGHAEKGLAKINEMNPEELKSKRAKTSEERYGGIGFASAELAKKSKQGIKQKYGTSHHAQSELYREEQGFVSLESKTDLQKYRIAVERFTRNQDIDSLPNSDKRGVSGVEGSYQLDHKFSIAEGFRLNIPAYILGNIKNLEFIPWEQNKIKGSNCSVTLEEIL